MKEGLISIYAVRNSDKTSLDNSELELLGAIMVKSDGYKHYEMEFTVSDNEITEYEPVCEGWGKK